MRSGVGVLVIQIKLAMTGERTINYISLIPAVARVIFFVWIKFFSFEKQFSF